MRKPPHKFSYFILVLILVGCASPKPPVTTRTRTVEVFKAEEAKASINISVNSPSQKSINSKSLASGFINKANVTINRHKESIVTGSKRVAAGRTCRLGDSNNCRTNYVNVKQYKHSWVADNITSSPLEKRPDNKQKQSLLRFYKDGRLINEEHNKLVVDAPKGTIFTQALLGDDKQPVLDSIFGSDLRFLNTKKLTFSRYLAQASPIVSRNQSVKESLFSKFKYFIDDLKYDQFTNLDILDEIEVQAYDSEAVIWYGVNYLDALNDYLMTINPSYNDIKLEAYDSLTYLPIRGLKFQVDGHENVLYNRAFYEKSNKINAIENQYLKSIINRYIDTNWFSNSHYRDSYSNGSVIRLSKSNLELSIRTLHPQYVSFASRISVTPNTNIVKVFIDRVGTVNRNAKSLNGGKVTVE